MPNPFQNVEPGEPRCYFCDSAIEVEGVNDSKEQKQFVMQRCKNPACRQHAGFYVRMLSVTEATQERLESRGITTARGVN